jgi:hypothetical protein
MLIEGDFTDGKTPARRERDTNTGLLFISHSIWSIPEEINLPDTAMYACTSPMFGKS